MVIFCISYNSYILCLLNNNEWEKRPKYNIISSYIDILQHIICLMTNINTQNYEENFISIRKTSDAMEIIVYFSEKET